MITIIDRNIRVCVPFTDFEKQQIEYQITIADIIQIKNLPFIFMINQKIDKTGYMLSEYTTGKSVLGSLFSGKTIKDVHLTIKENHKLLMNIQQHIQAQVNAVAVLNISCQ